MNYLCHNFGHKVLEFFVHSDCTCFRQSLNDYERPFGAEEGNSNYHKLALFYYFFILSEPFFFNQLLAKNRPLDTNRPTSRIDLKKFCRNWLFICFD